MIKKSLHFLLALLVYGFIAFLIAYAYPGRQNFDFSRLYPSGRLILNALWLTLFISIIALVLSMITGFLLYLASESKVLFIKYTALIFDEIVFGSPLIVFIIAVYYFIAIPSGISSRLTVGIIAFALYMAPYMKSIVSGAIRSIDPLQYQAMQVLGFNGYQKYRFIIIPQLLKVMFPPLLGHFTFIIKGSSLLSVIGVKELYFQIGSIQANALLYVEGYLLMFLAYLVITIPLIRLTRFLEKKVA